MTQTHAPVVLFGSEGATQAVEAALARAAQDQPFRLEKLGVANPLRSKTLRTIRQAGAFVCLIGPDAQDLEAARRVLLLCLHLSGQLPVMAGFGWPSQANKDQVALRQGVSAYADMLGAPPPVWADNIDALIAAITDRVRQSANERAAQPLRMLIDSPVAGSAVSGRVVAGTPQPGLDVVLLPSAAAATIATVNPVNGGGSFAMRLDREVATQAGTVLAAAAQRPELADQVAAHVVWAGKEPMLPGRPYRLRICGRTTTAQISSLRYKLNPADLTHVAARRLEAGDVGFCNLSFSAAMIFDAHETAGKGQAQTSQFEVEDASSGEILGAGHIAFTLRRSTNIHWQALAVDKSTRASLKGQRPCCLWFTGLSGSGKSTVASLLEKRLTALQRHTYTLDGDNVRHGLNRDLGFTDADRVENIRRVVEVSKLFVEAGLIVMVSFISPFRAERRMARDVFAAGEFIEIFVDTPIDVCERRDVKGLYKKARAGQLKNFTGIDSPYEPPENPEIALNGAAATAEELVERVLQELSRRNML